MSRSVGLKTNGGVMPDGQVLKSSKQRVYSPTPYTSHLLKPPRSIHLHILPLLTIELITRTNTRPQ